MNETKLTVNETKLRSGKSNLLLIKWVIQEQPRIKETKLIQELRDEEENKPE